MSKLSSCEHVIQVENWQFYHYNPSQADEFSAVETGHTNSTYYRSSAR